MTLEGDSEEAVLHLSGQIGSGDCEFQEQERGAAAVLLKAEADAAFSVAEEGACECSTGGIRGRGGGGEGVLAVIPIPIA